MQKIHLESWVHSELYGCLNYLADLSFFICKRQALKSIYIIVEIWDHVDNMVFTHSNLVKENHDLK